jgi:RNA polymerase primary sigma factor
MTKKIIFTDRTDSLLNTYLQNISKYKILESSEINELIKNAQEGDMIAREKVINANLRFVITVAKQFQNRGIPLMDLISTGNIGLMKAIDKFDTERGVTFLSYAIWWIKQSIFNSIYWQSKEIRLPMSQQLLVNTITDTIDKFIKEHHRSPSSIEISEITNIPSEQIDFLAQYSNKLVSVDDFIGGDEDNSQVCDVIPDEGPELEDTVNKVFVNEELYRILDGLTDREHDLLRMLFGIGMPQISTKVIADMYGVCGERIRQMKEAALAKIRKKNSKRIKELLYG